MSLNLKSEQWFNTKKAENTNQWFVENVDPNYKPPYKPGTLVEEIELAEDTTFQVMLESYDAALNLAMEELVKLPSGRYFKTFGGWELGINTETGVVYHALPVH